MRQCVIDARRIVVKIGSSLLTASGSRLDVDYIRRLSEDIAALKSAGREIIIVSSGAVAAGVHRLGQNRRPSEWVDRQVAAAVGQMALINAYEDAFARYRLHAAQILLTAEDMANRTLYLNARATLRRMLHCKVIPLINENDVIATNNVSFGDNDLLAAQIANLMEADMLVMLTDAPGVCRDGARLSDVIRQGRAADETLMRYVDDSRANAVGSGGMGGKLLAARVAARSGAHTLITDGRTPRPVERALSGSEEVGTLLIADMPRWSARKQWLASGLHVRGTLVLDDGAVRAVVGDKRSLLPAGVKSVSGEFVRGDAVKLVSADGQTVGYALVNYAAAAAARICGVNSRDIGDILGYVHEEEMAHRDNMTILQAAAT